MRLFLLYKRRWWLLYLPVLLCAAMALWWSATRLFVLPPSTVVIAAGSPEGNYARLAQRYAVELEERDISVEIVYSGAESLELEQLLDKNDSASVGFGHSVFAGSSPSLQALAAIENEPVWVFSTLNGPSSLSRVKGMRVAAGTNNSAPFVAAKLLLEHSGLQPQDVIFSPEKGVAAADALINGKVDVVVATAADDAQLIQTLTRLGGVQVISIEQAGALAAKGSVLEPLLLPEGALEMGSNLPPKDITMVGLQTNLLIKPSVHPALQRSLIEVATDIHEQPNFLQPHGQFPRFSNTAFTLSPVAKAFRSGKRPWLETMLPYRVAQGAELLLYAVLPILALAAFALTRIPRLFNWRVSASLNHFYGDLKFLESEMEGVAASNPMALRSLIERLDRLEQQVVAMELPDHFCERWYTLREHLSAAQDRLFTLRAR